MRELGLLLKTRFKNTYDIGRIFNVKKGKLVLYALLAIYVLASLLISVSVYAQLTADALNKYHLISYLIVLFFILVSFVTFMLTIYNAKTNMFNANDNDLLLSMPIKSSTILASRLLYITIWNLIIAAFIMLPVYVIYIMNVNVSFNYYIYAFIVLILLPVVPTILACIIGYIIAYFSSKSNTKNLIEILLSFAAVGLLYLGMAKANDFLSYIATHVDNFEDILKWGFYPVYLVEEIFSKYSVTSVLLYIVVNISLFIIFTYILSINFKKIIAKLQENRSKSNYVMHNLKTSPISKTLYAKELKRFLSSPIYVMNTSFGVVMLLVGAIASIFNDKTQVLKALQLGDGSTDIFPMLIAGILFIIFMSNTASSSISIEGKNFWIMKTLPLDPRKVFGGKMWLNISVVLPATIVSLVILYFTFSLTVVQLIIGLALAILTSFVTAQLGILMNLKFPKMDAINDVAIVKRGASSMISMLVPMAIIFGVSGLYALISDIISFNILLVIIFIILIVMYFVERQLLTIYGVKRFKEID